MDAVFRKFLLFCILNILKHSCLVFGAHYIDEDVFAYDELWAAAGTPHAVFCLRADDLKKIVQGEIVVCKS